MKNRDSLLVRANWKLRNLMPDPVESAYVRGCRRLLQLKGYPFSGRRRGVVMMLHIGRCGSTVLANLLAQNLAVYWDGKTARKAHELYGESVKALDVAAWFKSQFSISGSRFYGFEFKILRDQYVRIFDLTVPEFLAICQNIGVTHYIFLYRQNTLNQAISHYSGLNNKVWHISAESEIKASKRKFRINFQSITTGYSSGMPLRKYLRDVEDTKDEVRHRLRGQNILELEYERDILERGPQAAYNEVCDFLSVPPGDVVVKNKKVLTLLPSEAVENYDDAVQALTGTEFEWMLNKA